jgi:N-methylhydantoinase B
VLRVGTQGGGGHGDPLDREPERVLADVRAGFVSPARAREDYGVVTDGTTADLGATDALRAERRRARAAATPPQFGFGAEREAYERVWPDALRTALVRALEPYPGRLRTFLCERVSRLVEARAAAGEPVTPEALAGLVTATLTGLRWR